MAFKRMMDLHVHTDNSFDGHHSAMFLCEQAVHKGLRAIAFTDHMDIDLYEQQNLEARQIQSFFEVSKARSAFQGKLLVLNGIELGQGTFDMPLSEKSIQKFDYDFVIGSMHELRDSTDYSQLKYDEYTMDELNELLEQYSKELYQLALWGHFDTMAHITYPLRYLCGAYKIPYDFSRFDLGTFAFVRRPLRDFHPNDRIRSAEQVFERNDALHVAGILVALHPERRYHDHAHTLKIEIWMTINYFVPDTHPNLSENKSFG